MHQHIPGDGAAMNEVARKAIEEWAEAAAAAGVDMEGFDPSSEDQISWALSKGLDIGTVYARFSSQLQQSTSDQIRECVVWAARNNIFVPQTLICVDEAVTGKRQNRVGLERIKAILASREATCLLVFKASRLFRQAGQGFLFIQEHVVEQNLRAVSVSQSIDTHDRKAWKLQLQVHGLLDDLLLDAIADHVRAGQIGHFLNMYTTGALGVGYRRKEIPGARPTNRGLPRTRPEVDPEAAELIRKHAQLLLDGMSVREGVRRWNQAGGPFDPRSTTKKMSPPSYRRLFSNPRLTGRWEFGRMRNQFSTKRDGVKQVEQPDEEVIVRHFEQLRILDDEIFCALQRKFNQRKTGPRSTRDAKDQKLWDLTTSMFFCSHCSTPEKPVRFYMAGANGRGMRCCNGDDCPASSCVRRDEAVIAVCKSLAQQIERDAQLVSEVVARSRQLDSEAEDDIKRDIRAAQKKLAKASNRVGALYELFADSSGEDRAEVRKRLRAAQSERTQLQGEISRLQKSIDQTTATLSADDVRAALSDMAALLKQAARGDLGSEGVYKVLRIFGLLTGEQIWVTVLPRPGRKQTVVQGHFYPQLVRATEVVSGLAPGDEPAAEKVTLWLREPPMRDQLAPRVHELIDVEEHSFRSAAKVLQSEGHSLNSGVVWQIYHRYYEMIGKPVPKRPYNNGNKRRPKK